jgi:hypothetical protein
MILILLLALAYGSANMSFPDWVWIVTIVYSVGWDAPAIRVHFRKD